MATVFGRAIVAVFHAQGRAGGENVGVRPAQATASPSHSKCVLQEESSSTSSSSASAAATPVTTRSIFTGPLNFLWFAKQKDSQTIELSDVAFQPKDSDHTQLQRESGSSSSEAQSSGSSQVDHSREDPLQDDAVGRRSWVYNIWGLKSMIEKAPSGKEEQQVLEESNEIEDGIVVDEVENHLGSNDCVDCGMDCCIEVPHVQATHDKDTFSTFLHPVTLPDLKLLARLTHLCNLAYVIADIKPGELLRHHHLRFVTSSLDKKAEARAKEEEAGGVTAGDDKRTGSNQRFSMSPGAAYALASGVASYLHSHTKSLLQLKGQNDQNPVENEDANNADAVGNYDSSEMASMLASSPMTAVVAAKDGTRDAVAKDLQSLHSCPCEWYCCDDRRNAIRYFVIQGSESLASWQANLLFEPTVLEDSSLGVLVHRGIYEAAKGLYEQILPQVLEHLQEHGDCARMCFTGHSLGGSLATLVSLMLQIRGVVQSNAMLPVFTFGSPCIMCGGDFLLEKLGLPRDHIRSVMLHRDIVPRTFACDYPDPVAEVLKRLNGSFREHPCLNNQKLLYSPMGEFLILQPSEEDAPPHPLLPSGQGVYALRKSKSGHEADKRQQEIELRGAQRAFLNSPHPLEILSDRSAYGSEGTISRDHDPRSYMKAVSRVAREESKKYRRLKRDQRRRLWWPTMVTEVTSLLDASLSRKTASISEGQRQELQQQQQQQQQQYHHHHHRDVSHFVHHTQLVLFFFVSAKMVISQGLALFTW